MPHALIIGANGFSGRYLQRELLEHNWRVSCADITSGSKCMSCNLLEREEVKQLIAAIEPDAVVNLAGFSSVGQSWERPREAFELNLCATVNLLEVMRYAPKKARILLIGSSEQYGDADGIATEETPQSPTSPYAIAKQAQEQLALLYAKAYDMDICLTRTFNSIGAGQRDGFVLSDFASGIVRVERGLCDRLRVGNTAAIRCFTDMRDTVRAYRLILERGQKGQVYNVGAETPRSVGELLDMLIGMATVDIPVEVDPERIRACDPACLRCDHSLLTADTGWQPEIPIEQTLREILEHYRSRETL